MPEFSFEPVVLPPSAPALRERVRQFLALERSRNTFDPIRNTWTSFNAEFSRRCGEEGLIGLVFPQEYGGQGMTNLERYVVMEELIAGGAPVGAHWIADRQSGMQILRHGTEHARRLIIPRIVTGQCYFAIGMSEPDSGSDLAAVRTRAVRVDGGWRITGTKVWTSNAHRAHYLIALVRTAAKTEARHEGMTQFIVDMSQPGVTTRPIYNLYGGHDFNEVVFDDHFVPDEMVLGQPGEGWSLVTGELAYERSAPDRFMTVYAVLLETMRKLGPTPEPHAAAEMGRFVAHLAALRFMSNSIAGKLQRGEQPIVEAALVKDIGTTFEREIPEVARKLIPNEPSMGRGSSFEEMLGGAMLRAPAATIRGGTREILRGMIARGLGLR